MRVQCSVSSSVFTVTLLLGTSSAAVVDRKLAPSPYAPSVAICPLTPLVRIADSISSNEASYIKSRKNNADTALAAWLTKTNADFGTDNLPIVGLTSSGGGYRALLNGAGVIQAFDLRDSNDSVAGLYQALTYQAGLSGGAWLLSSMSGNNWPTVSCLQMDLWETAFQDSALDPGQLTAGLAYKAVTNDISAKAAAGFEPTLTDPWGRLLSYQLLEGSDGGVSTSMSGLTSESNFTSFR